MRHYDIAALCLNLVNCGIHSTLQNVLAAKIAAALNHLTAKNWCRLAWTNLSWQDKTWAEFSSLDLAMFVQAMNWIHFVKQPHLKLKTQPKQLIGSLPLTFKLPALGYAKGKQVSKSYLNILTLVWYGIIGNIEIKITKPHKKQFLFFYKNFWCS
jgi:hypothetical protein